MTASTSSQPEKQWFALYTRARNEKKVAKLLTDADFEVYLPLKKSLKTWSDRKKWVEEPLIPSYLFVKIHEHQYTEVLTFGGAVRFIFFGGKIAPIPDWQINSLQILMTSQAEVNLLPEHFPPGTSVEVTDGPLKTLRGEIIDIRGSKRVILRIDSLRISLSVEVSLDHLRRI